MTGAHGIEHLLVLQTRRVRDQHRPTVVYRQMGRRDWLVPTYD